MRDLILLAYARVGFAGLSPVAPGTCGSFVALLLAPFLFMPLPLWGRLLLLLFVFASGAFASGRAEQLLGQSDPSEVVIDEVLGQWITFLPFAALGPREYLAGFVLFRFFDILKPWPVRQLEALGGGLGIMVDDAAAGVYAMLCLALLRRLL
ncbi:phosphatidylglycerophosphatase A [Desulfovibrio sp. OttesenSCG-928-M14]|nr:phosphatidylglycerophosphatase A [Desulfovibrio sp. OttesenSCG-928-M14]